MKRFTRVIPWLDLGVAWTLVAVSAFRADFYVCMASGIAIATLWRVQYTTLWMGLTQKSMEMTDTLLEANDKLMGSTTELLANLKDTTWKGTKCQTCGQHWPNVDDHESHPYKPIPLTIPTKVH